MTTLKRVLATIAIIIAILVAFISVGGVAGTWIVNGILTRGAERILVGAERALDVTSEGLGKVDTRLEGARVSVKTVEDTVAQMGDDVVETNFALAIIEKTVGEELYPRVDAARETISAIRASVIALNNTLEAANELPFVSVPTLTDELQSVNDRVTETRTAVDEIRTAIVDAKTGAVGNAVNAITSRTSRVDDGLAAVQGLVSEYDLKVFDARAEVTALKSKVATGLDLIAIVFTLWFVWVAISQIAVISVSWSRLRAPGGSSTAMTDYAYQPEPEPLASAAETQPDDEGAEPGLSDGADASSPVDEA
jgi:hypothetical protein